MTAYAHRRDIKSVKAVLREMEDAKVAPTVVTYRVLLGAYRKAGNRAAANAVMQKLSRDFPREMEAGRGS
eukprot:CAMPEP_0118859832 /NCGR_PEP_ID=MMETSP1163-20130328/5883_1 /TAXON_ID=124430 /ORGANISM="Phaeomonas parva, Strain CCMP2877" /LENGTH=69 /DNA_ID=CAMNT_0006793467 /DNA_START=8 /DNA_END=217 /DNA_ORIENTATION=-